MNRNKRTEKHIIKNVYDFIVFFFLFHFFLLSFEIYSLSLCYIFFLSVVPLIFLICMWLYSMRRAVQFDYILFGMICLCALRLT